MIDLSKAVFFLDGQSEIDAFRQKLEKEYSIRPNLRKVTCNGILVKPECYARAAEGTLHLALRATYLHIIVVYDRESRREEATRIAELLKQALVKTAVERSKVHEDEAGTKIHVFVADRMFENWIVADIEGIKVTGLIKSECCTQENFDGRNGATILEENMVVPYKKTQHGPTLFKAVRFDVASANSPSFSRMHTYLLGRT